MFKEFKEFAVRGNVVDMAVGIIVGAAFTSVVNSLVKDVIMPPIGLLAGGLDFSNLFVNLGPGEYETLAAAREAGAATVNYGLFINAVISFLIVAFVVFLLIRQVNRLKRPTQPVPQAPSTRECPYCLSTVPLAARRCAHCTSELQPAAPTAAT